MQVSTKCRFTKHFAPDLEAKNFFLKVKLYHCVIGGFPFHILNPKNMPLTWRQFFFLKVKLYRHVIRGFPFHILNRKNIVSAVPYTQKRLKWNLFKNSLLLHRGIQLSSRRYLCVHKSPYVLHPVSQKFSQHCLGNSSAIHQTFARHSQFPFTANIQQDEITLIIVTSLP